MNEETDSQGRRDLKRATRWCALAWGCILLGRLAMPLHGIVPIMGGGILAMSGLLFSLISAFLAFLGVLFPDGVGRFRFVLLLVLSAMPYTLLWWTLPLWGPPVR